MANQQKHPPTRILAIGPVELVIWQANHGDRGETRTSIQVSRCYQDVSGQWRRSRRLFVQDLPPVAALCEKAYRELEIRDVEPSLKTRK